MELGVAGIDAGDEPGGCRGTGVVETVAREHGEERARVLRVPGVAVKLMATVVWPLDGRSLVGDEFVRWRGSVFKGATATARNPGGEEGDSVRKLTAVTQRSSDGSGRRQGRRTVPGDLGAEAAGSSSGRHGRWWMVWIGRS